ncbi:MAG: hypothetical protein CXR31_08835 [Geobacter sp.]|nr:MAG: hypothetical protein CXR31_08835 [Geobacter sp.]
MELYKLTALEFAHDLSGEGTRIHGGRWTPKGIPAIYTAESVALCALEILVRVPTPKMFSRNIIAVPDTASIETVSLDDLPTDWQLVESYDRLHSIGKSWAKRKDALLLKVPSAVVSGEGWNYIINPLHPEIAMVEIKDTAPFCLDHRLFKNNR